MSTSVIDYIFRELAVTYLGREDLAHVPADQIETRNLRPTQDANPDVDSSEFEKPTDAVAKQPAPKKEPAPAAVDTSQTAVEEQQTQAVKSDSYESEYDKAKQMGYTGEACPECGSMTMVRNGTCMKCITCGSTTGCS